tara:strand:- start:963 stop:1517 length:555 start_codon:yes stop_codon:yes gene_type:complete
MLGTLKKDFKFKKVKNFLTPDEVGLLTNYCKIKHSFNTNSFDIASNRDTFFYEDPLMQSLLIQKKSLMEMETNLHLFETYSFWRMYTFAADLKPHKDRPSCEVSATVNINSDGTPWSIFMDGNEVFLKPGEGVIYLGCDLEHGRNHFKGDWCAQVFLHYVDQEGPFKSNRWDNKQFNGIDRHEI